MAAKGWKLEIKEFLGLLPGYYDSNSSFFVEPSFGDPRFAINAEVNLFNTYGLAQPYGLVALTNGTSAGAVTTLIDYILDYPVPNGESYAAGGNLLHQIGASTVQNAGGWPHTVDKAAVTGETIKGLCHYAGALYYAYNTSGSPDVGKWDLASTYDDDYMSTVPTGGAVLPDGNSSQHPMVVGGDNIMYIGAGRYVSSFNTVGAVFTAQALDLPSGMDIVDLRWHEGRLFIAANRGTLNSASKVYSSIYVWDTVSSSWEYEITVVGRIGTMYVKDGLLYLWWREADSTVQTAITSKLGFLNGLVPTHVLTYNGSPPHHGQVTQLRGHLIWSCEIPASAFTGRVFAYGTTQPGGPKKLFQPVGLGNFKTSPTAAGAVGSPFGSFLLSYTNVSSVIHIDRMDDDNVTPITFSIEGDWQTPKIQLGNGSQRGIIRSIVVTTNELESGAACAVTISSRSDVGAVSTAGSQIAFGGKSRVRHHVYNGSLVCNEFYLDFDFSVGSTSKRVIITGIYIEGEYIDAF